MSTALKAATCYASAKRLRSLPLNRETSIFKALSVIGSQYLAEESKARASRDASGAEVFRDGEGAVMARMSEVLS